MRAISCPMLLLAAVAIFAGGAGFASIVPIDDCCQPAAPAASDDCCPSVCDHCLCCTPALALVIPGAPSAAVSEPEHWLETARFRDPLAPEPRGILHVPKSA